MYSTKEGPHLDKMSVTEFRKALEKSRNLDVYMGWRQIFPYTSSIDFTKSLAIYLNSKSTKYKVPVKANSNIDPGKFNELLIHKLF